MTSLANMAREIARLGGEPDVIHVPWKNVPVLIAAGYEVHLSDATHARVLSTNPQHWAYVLDLHTGDSEHDWDWRRRFAERMWGDG